MSLNRTEFEIPKMDCPSEERIIRMALDKVSTKHLKFDIATRRLIVIHKESPTEILALLEPLGFGARILSSEETEDIAMSEVAETAAETSALKAVLAINAAMFFFEITFGIYAQSTGLIADSLDMFADAAVYGLSLYAVSRAAEFRRRAARMSGLLQIALALGTFVEVIRRFVFQSEPEGTLMIGIACIALIANISCLFLLARHRQGDVHMKASWIFSTNDVIANIGVILAGVLVVLTGNKWPDLVVGSIIATVVFIGGLRILKLSRK